MAKTQITGTTTIGANGYEVESGLGNVVIGGARVNLTSVEFPFTVPGGTVIESYSTQDFVIFGDDTPAEAGVFNDIVTEDLEVNGPVDVNLGGQPTTAFVVAGRTDSNGTEIPAILIRGSVLTTVGAQVGDSVVFLNHLPVFANEGAASALLQGQVYQTSTGELRIKL